MARHSDESLRYPPPEAKKKAKIEKDRVSKFLGAAKEVEANPDGHVRG